MSPRRQVAFHPSIADYLEKTRGFPIESPRGLTILTPSESPMNRTRGQTMLPTIAEIQAAEATVAASAADPDKFFPVPVAATAPVAFSAALPATKTSQANAIDYAAGVAIIDGKGKKNIAEYRIM